MNMSWWFGVGLLAAAMIAIVCVVLASLYDIRRIRMFHKARHTRTRRPHMTIMIEVRHANDDVAACIRSVRRLRYRRYDIVVFADSRASIQAKRIARSAASRGRVYIARKVSSPEILIRSAYRRSQRGEFVLLLDASQSFVSSSLNQAVTSLEANHSTAGVVLGSALSPVMSMKSMIETMGWLSWKLAAKACAMTGLYRSRNMHTGRLYRREMIDGKVRRHRLTYDSQTMISGAVKSQWLLARVGGYLVAAGLIAIITYAGIMAASLQTTEPLLLSWLAVVFWVGITIWLDDAMRLQERIGLTVCLPVSYFAIAGAIVVNSAGKVLHRRTF